MGLRLARRLDRGVQPVWCRIGRFRKDKLSVSNFVAVLFLAQQGPTETGAVGQLLARAGQRVRYRRREWRAKTASGRQNKAKAKLLDSLTYSM